MGDAEVGDLRLLNLRLEVQDLPQRVRLLAGVDQDLMRQLHSAPLLLLEWGYLWD